eukprot:gb/GECG01008852.1/.p1 GENE.gb/GECG01008852.1/~~gb/GECG01008852.1/.p1  ORF type:complete len:454 (+),score=62.08 gb/GECG01008852.1/:1-1362(+)
MAAENEENCLQEDRPENGDEEENITYELVAFGFERRTLGVPEDGLRCHVCRTNPSSKKAHKRELCVCTKRESQPKCFDVGESYKRKHRQIPGKHVSFCDKRRCLLTARDFYQYACPQTSRKCCCVFPGRNQNRKHNHDPSEPCPCAKIREAHNTEVKKGRIEEAYLSSPDQFSQSTERVSLYASGEPRESQLSDDQDMVLVANQATLQRETSAASGVAYRQAETTKDEIPEGGDQLMYRAEPAFGQAEGPAWSSSMELFPDHEDAVYSSVRGNEFPEDSPMAAQNDGLSVSSQESWGVAARDSGVSVDFGKTYQQAEPTDEEVPAWGFPLGTLPDDHEDALSSPRVNGFAFFAEDSSVRAHVQGGGLPMSSQQACDVFARDIGDAYHPAEESNYDSPEGDDQVLADQHLNNAKVTPFALLDPVKALEDSTTPADDILNDAPSDLQQCSWLWWS